ncbi:MAG: hypothetical protein U0821_24560 [Chloroflexota bacterium]
MRRGRTALEYAAVALVALVATYPVLDLAAFSAGSAPLYRGDGLFHLAINKSLIENTWYFNNPRLAAPFGQDFYDFPFPETIHFILIKLLSLFSSDAIVVTNMFILILYPITAISAMYSLRIMGISTYTSFGLSALYAFQWYHLIRQNNHLMLAAYYAVPPVLGVAYLVCARRPLNAMIPAGWRQRPRRLAPTIVAALLIAAGASGLYYAVFSAISLALAGIIAALSQRTFRPLMIVTGLSAIVVGALAANIAPNAWYMWRHGPSSESTVRYAYSAEEHALGLTYLVVPPVLHRLPGLAQVGRKYYDQLPDPYSRGEGWSAWLGVAGTVGLGLSLLVVFSPRGQAGTDPVRSMSLLLLGLLLLASARGVLPLFAAEAVPLIRAPNRLSIFVAFIALYVLGVFLDRWLHQARIVTPTRRAVVLGAIVCFGLWDQSPVSQSAAYLQSDAQARIARDYVTSAERLLPPGASIFQLPITRFPESAPMYGLGSYEQLRGFLFSDRLRWSSGAVSGRVAGWAASAAVDEPARSVFRVTAAGFSAVEVDRAGYADNGAAAVESFTRILGSPILTSSDQRIILFSLNEYRSRLSNHPVAQALAACAESAQLHTDFFWVGAPSGTEYAPGFYLLNTHAHPELRLRNRAATPRAVRFDTLIRAWVPDGAPLTITGPNFTVATRLTAEAYQFERELTLPPGETQITFNYGGKQLISPTDPRKLFLMFVSPVLRDDCDREINRLPAALRNLGKPA